MAIPVVMSYSGGKDSSLALYEMLHQQDYQVKRLLTTVTEEYQRSSMHGVQIELVKQQAESIGLPLDLLWLSPNSSNEEYQARTRELLQQYQEQGIFHVAFGDLYLEDVRSYREKLNASAGMQSLFPVWGIPTKEFAQRFIDLGFKAIVVCVDTEQLDGSFVGREFDTSFLNDLPEGVDWCAEKGEFHTFCYDGPIFRHPLGFERGRTTLRDNRFIYIDLIPK